MCEYLRTFGRLNRDIRLYLLGFGLTSFAYFGITGVLFNLYLVRLGFGAEFIGLLIGSGQLVWAVMALPAAAIAARIGLTRALALSEVLIASGFSLVLLVEWLPRSLWEEGLVAGWMTSWIGAALLTVNGVPFLMAATSVEERKHAFSLQQAMMALLTFTGSLVAGWLPDILAGWMGTTLDDPAPYRLTLWLAPLTFAVAGLHFWAMRPVVPQADEDDHRQRSAAPLGLFIFFTVMVFLMSIGEGAVRNFFNLYLDRELHVATAQIGTAMGVAQLLPVIIALLIPWILGRLGSGMTQVVASVALALCIALMGLVPHLVVATAALLGMQTAVSIVGPARNLFSQEIVASRWRTTTPALATIGLASGWAAAAAFGGYAITVMGYRAFFLLCSGLVMGSACLLLLYWWWTKVALRKTRLLYGHGSMAAMSKRVR